MKKTLNENISSLNSYVNELKNISNETKVELIKTTNDHEVKLIKELNNNFTSINDRLVSNNEVTIKKLDDKLNSISDSLKETLEKIEKTTKDSISDIRKDNNEKLDSIQNLVSNKLEDTLNKRLKESFGNVIEQINGVNKAIGEIKGLANDVGSLKNVLTNVKTKGITGEIILGNLISEILTKNQYDENVITKPGSKDRVEFAIKMPGNGEGEYIYLPVDSKFPTTQYQRILEGIDEGNKVKLKMLESNLELKSNNLLKIFLLNTSMNQILLHLELCFYQLKAYMLKLLTWAYLKNFKENIKLTLLVHQLLQHCLTLYKWDSNLWSFKRRAQMYLSY